MSFRILRKNSSDYKEKLRILRNTQLKIDAKRWATITERPEIDNVLDKLLAESSDVKDPSLHLTLARKLKQQIEDEHLDLKIVQGNMEIRPALRLLEDQK
jgi:hypothetical protein